MMDPQTLAAAVAAHMPRRHVEDLIERLIAELDERDGDPDVEPEVDDDDCEDPIVFYARMGWPIASGYGPRGAVDIDPLDCAPVAPTNLFGSRAAAGVRHG